MKKESSHFVGGVFLCNDAVDHPANHWFKHASSFVHETVAEHIASLTHMLVLVQDRDKKEFDPEYEAGLIHIAKRSLNALHFAVAETSDQHKPKQKTSKVQEETRVILGVGDLRYCVATLCLMVSITGGTPEYWMGVVTNLLDRQPGDVVWVNSRQPTHIWHGSMETMFRRVEAAAKKYASR